MKETKTRLNLFSFYDRTGIESYLEKQAEKGWLLEEASAFRWRFRRAEPRKVRFAVTYFPEASIFEPEPSEGQTVLWDFCEHAGWNLVASNIQMQIFCSEKEDPVPIETDAMMEVEQIHAAAKDSFLPANALLALAGALLLCPFANLAESYPLGLLTSNADLLGGPCALLLIALCAAETGCYYLWRRSAIAAAQLNGGFVETRSIRGISLLMACLLPISVALSLMCRSGNSAMTLAVAAVALVAGSIAVVARITGFMRRKKASSNTNFAISCVAALVAFVFASRALVFLASNEASPLRPPEREPAETYVHEGVELGVYHDGIPLVIEDLIEVDYDDFLYRVRSEESSLAVEQLDACQGPRWDAVEQPHMEYTVTEAKLPMFVGALRAFAMDDFVNNYYSMPPGVEECAEAIEVDAVPWGAEEAYQVYGNGEPGRDFLLYYDNRVVKIGFVNGWALTDDQMAAVGEKLGKGPVFD